MKSKRCLAFAATFTVVFGLSVTAQVLAAAKERVLHSFCSGPGCPDGLQPNAGVILDAAGNLYGTTYEGGEYTWGTVFELSPSANGAWNEKVLHSFNYNGTDGYQPWAGLIFDTSGNLYGTTLDGGSYFKGTVFELTPGKNGAWTEKVLHSFNPEAEDGAGPIAGLILDESGNLYGTTSEGGANSNCNCGCGTVFELTRKNGFWKEKVLHSFNGNDGDYPSAGLIFDTSGNLYGTTEFGGTNNYGTVFELTPGKNGAWEEKVLHSFNGNDGVTPGQAALVFDASSSLYGTTYFGGTFDYGTVFELTPGANGAWNEKVLHSFNYNGKDGALPFAGLVFGASGNLYGTTESGGANNNSDCIREGCGTVFELTPGPNGKWTEKVLHSFANNGTDGFEPLAGVILDGKGKLYGTTVIGGAPGSGCAEGGYGCGTVFEVSP